MFKVSLIRVCVAACCLCVILVGCNNASIHPSENAEIQHCEPWAEIALGELLIQNNTWAVDSLENYVYTQCIYQEQAEGTFPSGWSWDFPPHSGPYEVSSYPEIIYGWKPWNPTSTTSQLPRTVAEIEALTVVYDINMTLTGEYNLAFDIWLTSGDVPSEETITQELMIWQQHEGLSPAGRYVETVSIDGEAYRFFYGNVSHAAWPYIAFVKEEPELKGDTKIHLFLAYLVDNGYISDAEYVASIEFGNEVVHGTGTTTFNNFKVSVK